ncbi:hypothetical protein GMORB2_1996 [Geosmithia morbida]|uniref:Ubiquitin thioesterase OTU n=1 Tax=Geosmithia morbida TaxID=1094350 RepID=A0A9P4YTV7_9HYPO|nr:uncharacterized protein GMORB2_1996 [Geosmithia morbida]KAF4121588.1 hypothetical protein GMORB2_1996 [Geosmithia morbida]
MKARFKGPSGTGVIELDDTAGVENLCKELRERTGIQEFSIKYGPPMAMRTLDTADKFQSVKSLGLHGETLTIVPNESNSSPTTSTQKAEPHPRYISRNQRQAESKQGPEEITVPWPEREGTLSFGGALQTQIPAAKLRKMMADYISQHQDVYTEAVLGSPPMQYCRSIQDPDRWGGGIELSILSSIFDIQICTYDVQTQNLINFGENKRDRCVLVYSGIHYDRVAFTYSEFPHKTSTLPPEMDRTLWPTEDDEILNKTRDLIEKLNKAHYYTDTESLVLRCDVPGCDWIGSGQAEGSKHAQQTGHVELSEIHDTEEDNVLRQCGIPGCDFIGQGSKVMRQHTADTTHDRYSVIPDW